MYFLANVLWNKVNLGGISNFENPQFSIYLSNLGNTNSTQGATLVEAIKCALANIIAFSSVLGKVGPL